LHFLLENSKNSLETGTAASPDCSGEEDLLHTQAHRGLWSLELPALFSQPTHAQPLTSRW